MTNLGFMKWYLVHSNSKIAEDLPQNMFLQQVRCFEHPRTKPSQNPGSNFFMIKSVADNI